MFGGGLSWWLIDGGSPRPVGSTIAWAKSPGLYKRASWTWPPREPASSISSLLLLQVPALVSHSDGLWCAGVNQTNPILRKVVFGQSVFSQQEKNSRPPVTCSVMKAVVNWLQIPNIWGQKERHRRYQALTIFGVALDGKPFPHTEKLRFKEELKKEERIWDQVRLTSKSTYGSCLGHSKNSHTRFRWGKYIVIYKTRNDTFRGYCRSCGCSIREDDTL